MASKSSLAADPAFLGQGIDQSMDRIAIHLRLQLFSQHPQGLALLQSNWATAFGNVGCKRKRTSGGLKCDNQ